MVPNAHRIKDVGRINHKCRSVNVSDSGFPFHPSSSYCFYTVSDLFLSMRICGRSDEHITLTTIATNRIVFFLAYALRFLFFRRYVCVAKVLLSIFVGGVAGRGRQLDVSLCYE